MKSIQALVVLQMQTWTPHFFVLTSNKLYYSEETSNIEEEEDSDDESSRAVEVWKYFNNVFFMCCLQADT